jgi:heme-degrading monooxygenase HmoA
MEPSMSHVRIGIYALTNGTAQEVADLAREGMLNVFRAQPGFKAYGLAQTREGKLVSVSLWDNAMYFSVIGWSRPMLRRSAW